MKSVDNRILGRGLSHRAIRNALQSMSEAELDMPFLVADSSGGYDYLSYFGPAEPEMEAKPFILEGRPMGLLQDRFIVDDDIIED